MTDVQICNMALRRLGGEAINSLDENSEGARLCKTFYESSLKAVLRDHYWNFATARATLALLSAAPAFDFAYAYQLPTDCVFVRSLNMEGFDFAVEGRTLITDLADAKILYTKYVNDPNLYDAIFISALAYRIATEIAYPLTNSVTKIQAMNTMYINEVKKAKVMDASEGKKEVVDDNDWLRARL